MPHVVRRRGVATGARLAVFLALVHAVNDVLTAVLGALLPTFEARFAISATTLALLVAVFTVSSSLTQPILGALADWLGLRRVAAAGVVTAAVSLSLAGPAASLPALFVLLLLGGLGSAGLHPAATSIVGSPTVRNPGLGVGAFTAGGMAGFAAGPVLILYLVSRFGADALVWLMVPGVLLGVLTYVLLPDWEPHGTARIGALFDRHLLTGPTGLLAVAATLVSVAFITFTSAVPLWLVREHGLATDSPLLGWTLAAFSLAAGLGALTGGAVAPRLGRRATIVGSISAAALPLVALLLLRPGTVLFFLVVVSGGLLIYASQPLLIVTAQETAPRAPAAAAGMVIGLSHGVAGGLYIGIGKLQDVIGLEPAMVVSFLLLVPAAFIAGRVLPSQPPSLWRRARRSRN